MKKKYAGGLLAVYAASTLLFSLGVTGGTITPQNISARNFSLDAGDLAVMSLEAVYPGAMEGLTDSRDNEAPAEGIVMAEEEENPPEPVIFGKDPAVLIVHTHATETYLPAAEGNYHSRQKENSVRDVGSALAESLKEEGIAVVHDETLHDSPSYSNSYSRSYETIQALLEEYPTVRCIIDLHRDAIASEDTAPVVSAKGKTCAKYMYVVSTAVPTYESNLKFVKALNREASEDYSGFTGSVLERGYQYNQGLSDRYLLLEIGNNRNHIDDARNTARIYGKILAQTLKAGY